ncbi:hypothetical protein [Culicoidibacter larvae]|uniref:Uncharacterized protein n=1 Tax=Culicoidibacter larvae TaxID=2579976 RepID=A0A5R8Q9W8_9FIRM|nr:hypothetical protein [Culicoidibacter larvae]TLG72723.1 hypothetical protein FEZ08_08455 [Culicoidibacter larvae]
MEYYFIIYGIVMVGVVIVGIGFAIHNRNKKQKLKTETPLAVEVLDGKGVTIHTIDDREPQNVVTRNGGYVYILPSGTYVFEVSHQYSRAGVMTRGSETITTKKQKLRTQLDYGYVYKINYNIEERRFFFEKKAKADK